MEYVAKNLKVRKLVLARNEPHLRILANRADSLPL